VANDFLVLLPGCGHEAGDVDEGDERDVEVVAKADEAGGLGRGLAVREAGEHRALVGDDAGLTGRCTGRTVTSMPEEGFQTRK
jgi:hypothetical protein